MNALAMNRRILITLGVAISLGVAFLAGKVMTGASVSEGALLEEGAAGRQLVRSAEWELQGRATAAERTLELLGQLDRCVSSEDFQQLLSSIETRADKSEKHRFLALLFGAWLERDPISALSEVRRVEVLRSDSSRVGAAFYQWASNDPSAAASLLARVLDGRQSDPASNPPFLDGVNPPDFLLSVVSGLASSDPRLAATTLRAAQASPVRTSGFEVLMQDWYPAQPAAAREWSGSIDDAETRALALSVVATKAGQRDDLDASLSWAMGLSGDDQLIALESLTGQWSQRRAVDAFEWVGGLSDESLKLALMPAVIRHVTIVDPGAAADWLNQYDAAPEMDASVAAYAKAIQFVNPPAALGSAEAITDPALRESVIALIKRNQSR